MSRTRSFNLKEESEKDLLPKPLNYFVEHLCTFAYGEQFEIVTVTDGMNKLTQCSHAGTVYPQKMFLRFTEDKVIVNQEDTKEVIEEFPLKLIAHPFAYESGDETEEFDNILGFVVEIDHSKNSSQSEMHLFRCLSISAYSVLESFENALKTFWKSQKQSTKRPSAFRKQNGGSKPPKTAMISVDADDLLTLQRKSNSLSSESPAPSSSSASPKTTLSADLLPIPEVRITEIPFIVDSPRVSPTFSLEHLATFKYGAKYGIPSVDAAIQKLRRVEKSEGLWVQKIILRIDKDAITLKDTDKKRVAKFPLELVCNSCAYLSSKSSDIYNNLLIFVIEGEHKLHPGAPEMYIFQCGSVSAKKIVQLLE